MTHAQTYFKYQNVVAQISITCFSAFSAQRRATGDRRTYNAKNITIKQRNKIDSKAVDVAFSCMFLSGLAFVSCPFYARAKVVALAWAVLGLNRQVLSGRSGYGPLLPRKKPELMQKRTLCQAEPQNWYMIMLGKMQQLTV